jgi:hypothetical protein
MSISRWKLKNNQANPCLRLQCTDWFPMLDITKVGPAHPNAASAMTTSVSGTRLIIQIKPSKVDAKSSKKSQRKINNCQKNRINIFAKKNKEVRKNTHLLKK